MLNMVFIRYLKLRDNDWGNSGTLSTFVLTSSLVEDLFILSNCSIIKVSIEYSPSEYGIQTSKPYRKIGTIHASKTFIGNSGNRHFQVFLFPDNCYRK